MKPILKPKIVKKRPLFAGIYWLAVLAPMAAHALEDIHAEATFVKAFSLSGIPMDFGAISHISGAGANTLTLQPESNTITCSNSAEYTCPSNGVRGEMHIVGTAGASVNIFCQEKATLASGQDTIALAAIRFGSRGSAFSCHGLSGGGVAYTVKEKEQANTLFIGGRIDIASGNSISGKKFSTDSEGGIAPTFRFVYL